MVENSSKILVVKDIALQELYSLREYRDGWDGPGSKSPKEQLLKGAGNFLSYWTIKNYQPEPELNFDGTISLQFYEENGSTIGGIEFLNQDRGVYAIVREKRLMTSGSFNPNSREKILYVINDIGKAFVSVNFLK